MKREKSNAMECIGAIRNVINRLVISEISYGDFARMSDWLGDIEEELERFESNGR